MDENRNGENFNACQRGGAGNRRTVHSVANERFSAGELAGSLTDERKRHTQNSTTTGRTSIDKLTGRRKRRASWRSAIAVLALCVCLGATVFAIGACDGGLSSGMGNQPDAGQSQGTLSQDTPQAGDEANTDSATDLPPGAPGSGSTDGADGANGTNGTDGAPGIPIETAGAQDANGEAVGTQNGTGETTDGQNAGGGATDTQSGANGVDDVTQTNADGSPWYLILVNKSNPIPEDYRFELTELRNGVSVDSRVYPALQQMFDTARSSGIYPIVVSGYRTTEEQQRLMNGKIADYKAEGYSSKKAKAKAKEWVAMPGTSEHQIGIAVDIGSDSALNPKDEVYAWLGENAYKFGFIRRYPEDKTKITGVINEPWHYRYVGTEVAAEIQKQGLCLEEYLGGA